MKTWMKSLMWFLLGAGAGFFAGETAGLIMASRRAEMEEEEAYEEEVNDISETLDEYRGQNLQNAEEVKKVLDETATDDEDPDMPLDEPVIPEVDIPQLHPQNLIPEIIGEEEYNANIWGYDLNPLIFYEIDDVLYDEIEQAPIENPEQIIGEGTQFAFGGDPNNPVEVIFVKNDTFGKLYRIDRVDAAFCDAVDGTCPPEDDAPEDDPEDFTRDDGYWDDV